MDVDVGASKDNHARILSFAYNDASWLIQTRWQKWSLNYAFVSCYFMFERHIPCLMCLLFVYGSMTNKLGLAYVLLLMKNM